MRFSLPFGTLAACFHIALASASAGDSVPADREPIVLDQLGATAQQQYAGDGIAITATADGAVISCTFQELEAQATAAGLWLKSTEAADANASKFRVLAYSLGRNGSAASQALSSTGRVEVGSTDVRFLRPGLAEEYRVSMDGVRQDFVVLGRPAGEGGELCLNLQVTGATATQTASGIELAVAGSGRKLCYSRLHVTDATGRNLEARMEVSGSDGVRIHVQDADAVYPIRIDPTFSDADWGNLGQMPGPNQGVIAVAVDTVGNVYIGGSFQVVGDTQARCIAKWDGSEWRALGVGISKSGYEAAVFEIAVSGTDVYVAGDFTQAGEVPANCIARWDGNAWHALGSGLSNSYEYPPVSDMVVSGSDLYVSGNFGSAGGALAVHVAKWDGVSWSAMDIGVYTIVSSLAVSGNTVYAACRSFNSHFVMKWEGGSWSGLGDTFDGPVIGVVMMNGALYAAGNFDKIGGYGMSGVARWSGSRWDNLGISGGLHNRTITSLEASGGALYVGGTFTIADGVQTKHLAKWSGSNWTTLGGGPGKHVVALAVSGDHVYALSAHDLSSSDGANQVSHWDGVSWTDLHSLRPTSVNGEVYALAVAGTDLFVGGKFTTAGGIQVNHIARWDGSEWSALGAGMNDTVLALAVAGGDVYAGGTFTTAGGVTANRVARWNGTSWSALGSGMNFQVNALCASGSDVYAGGQFTTAGGVSVGRIARWSGSTWSALGSGLDFYVHALAMFGTDLVAGGEFSSAGGQDAANVARWDGTAWLGFGAGMKKGIAFNTWHRVNAVTVSGGELYVGGSFQDVGPDRARNVAKWDGSAWRAVGSGLNWPVLSLMASGTDIYAGGAHWDGTAWGPMGSGVNNEVRALSLMGSDLFLGGAFVVAGNKVAGYIARASLQPAEISVSSGGIEITSGYAAPVSGSPADFGLINRNVGGVTSRTWTITNTGPETLHLRGTPVVKITGPGAADFSIDTQPAASVALGGSTNFSITFNPLTLGLKKALVTITSNDGDESPFTFAVQGLAASEGNVTFSAASYVAHPYSPEVSLTVERSGGTLPFEVTLQTDDGISSAVPPFSPAVAGKDYVDLAPPYTTLAFADGEMSKNVTVVLKPQAGSVTTNKRLKVSLSAPTNNAMLGAIPEAFIHILAADVIKPTLSVTRPARLETSFLPLMVTGMAGDAKGVARVVVTHGGSAPVTAVLGPAKSPTAVPWSAAIFPAEGYNSLSVSAYDFSGNSKSLDIWFTFARRGLLTLARATPTATPDDAGMVTLTIGKPTVNYPIAWGSSLSPTTPNSNPKTAEIAAGTEFTLKATAKPGYVFNHWTGVPGSGWSGSHALLRMPLSDLAVTATFIATPFATPASESSTYYGLIHPEAGGESSSRTVALVTGTLSSTGKFTGKILNEQFSKSFVAEVSGDGQCLFLIGSARSTNLEIAPRFGSFRLSWQPGQFGLSLTQTLGDPYSSDFRTVRGVGIATPTYYHSKRHVPAALLNSATKGSYTLRLAGNQATPSVAASGFPQGDGYATVTLSNLGAVTVAGTLSDGSSITGSSVLQAGDISPLYVPLPTPGRVQEKGGSISGVLAFDPSEPNSDILSSGDGLLWFRAPWHAGAPGNPAMYRYGWPLGMRVPAIGALYSSGLTVEKALGLGGVDGQTGNARLDLTCYKLASPVANVFNIAASKVSKLPGGPVQSPFTLLLNQSTGSFSGSFSPNWSNATTALPAFKGVLLQKGAQRGGYGYFISNAKDTPTDHHGGRVILGRQAQ